MNVYETRSVLLKCFDQKTEWNPSWISFLWLECVCWCVSDISYITHQPAQTPIRCDIFVAELRSLLSQRTHQITLPALFPIVSNVETVHAGMEQEMCRPYALTVESRSLMQRLDDLWDFGYHCTTSRRPVGFFHSNMDRIGWWNSVGELWIMKNRAVLLHRLPRNLPYTTCFSFFPCRYVYVTTSLKI